MNWKHIVIGYFVLALVALGVVYASEEPLGQISLIIPEATTNLVTNPSIEAASTGYTAVGGATVINGGIDTYQRRGLASLRVTPGAGNNDGVYYGITLTATTTYTWSVDVLGVDGVPYRLRVYDVTATADLATEEFDGDGEWHRLDLTFTTGANTGIRLYIEKDTSTDTNAYYVDGMQVEAKSYATTYCDGDQAGCEWTYGPDESTSTRSDQYRGGGRVIDLSADYDVSLRGWDGFGMPPVAHNIQELAQQPGALLQSIKVQPRVLTLSAYVGPGGDMVIHSDRAQLIDALKGDRVTPLQPVTVRYTGDSRIIDIPCYYDSGLQGSFPNFSIEAFALRLICYQPFWIGDGETATVFNATIGSSTMRLLAAKIDGEWEDFGPAASTGAGQIDALVIAPDGKVYIAGTFTNYNGNNDADYIAVYDPETDTWDDLGTPPDGAVQALAISRDGDYLYAGGLFTNIGGGAANRIAEYDIGGASWSALGAGTDGPVYGVIFGPDGYLYVAGDFDNAGGNPAANIAKWDFDGAAWSAVGTGPNDTIKDMVLGGEYIYVGGQFTQAGGNPAGYIARWHIKDGAWSTLGDGLGNAVNRIAIAPDGTIYVAGSFVDTGAGDTALRVAAWNGSIWSALGGGVDDTVWALAVAPDGSLYVGGEFTTAGDRSAADIARWTGYDWVYVDFTLSTTPGTYKVTELVFHGDDLYVGADRNGVCYYGATATVDNEGSAEAYPILHLQNSSTVFGTGLVRAMIVINETTGQELYLDYEMIPQETLYIDLTPSNQRIYSDIFGDMARAVLPMSDLTTFSLLPGENDITIMIRSLDVSAGKAYVQWRDRYWSVDGAE